MCKVVYIITFPRFIASLGEYYLWHLWNRNPDQNLIQTFITKSGLR